MLISHDGFDRNVDQIRKRHFERNRQTVADVVMPLSEHSEIERDDQRAALRGDCTSDQIADEAAIAHDVQLEPKRLLDGFGDVFDRADRHRAERERNSGGLRGASGKNLAVTVLHAADADRSQDERQRCRLAENRRAELPRRQIDADALAKFYRLEIVSIRAQRCFRI